MRTRTRTRTLEEIEPPEELDLLEDSWATARETRPQAPAVCMWPSCPGEVIDPPGAAWPYCNVCHTV